MSDGVQELTTLFWQIPQVRGVTTKAPTADNPDVPPNYIGFVCNIKVKYGTDNIGIFADPEAIKKPDNRELIAQDMAERISVRVEELSLVLGKDGEPVVP